jgi:ketosteroid isomerase-like protein
MTDTNKQLSLEFLQLAFANRTTEAIAMMHPDLTWWVSGDPERLKVSGLKNRAQAERLLHGVARAVPGGMKILIQGVTAEGNRVAVEIEADGAWHDGRRYRNRYHFMIEVREGKIAGVREYMDTLHLYELSQA